MTIELHKESPRADTVRTADGQKIKRRARLRMKRGPAFIEANYKVAVSVGGEQM